MVNRRRCINLNCLASPIWSYIVRLHTNHMTSDILLLYHAFGMYTIQSHYFICTVLLQLFIYHFGMIVHLERQASWVRTIHMLTSIHYCVTEMCTGRCSEIVSTTHKEKLPKRKHLYYRHTVYHFRYTTPDMC